MSKICWLIEDLKVSESPKWLKERIESIGIRSINNVVDITNFVEVIAADQDDPDSTPDNGNGVTPEEDDEAAVTISFLESFAGSIQTSGSLFTNSNHSDIENMNLFPVPTTDQLTVVLNALEEDVINARVISQEKL